MPATEETWIVGKPDFDVAPRKCTGPRIAPHLLKVSCMVVFRDEGTFEPTTEMLSWESRTNSGRVILPY